MRYNMSGTQTLYAIPTPFTPGGRSYLIKILNTASVNALQPGMIKGIYSISKAAVVNTTKALAKERSTLGICVNALVPGLKNHIRWRVVRAGRDIQAVTESIPMGRLATENFVGLVGSVGAACKP